jgi:hypothetical protein
MTMDMMDYEPAAVCADCVVRLSSQRVRAQAFRDAVEIVLGPTANSKERPKGHDAALWWILRRELAAVLTRKAEEMETKKPSQLVHINRDALKALLAPRDLEWRPVPEECPPDGLYVMQCKPRHDGEMCGYLWEATVITRKGKAGPQGGMLVFEWRELLDSPTEEILQILGPLPTAPKEPRR